MSLQPAGPAVPARRAASSRGSHTAPPPFPPWTPDRKPLQPARHASPQCSERRRGPLGRTPAPRRKPVRLRGSAGWQVTPAEQRGTAACPAAPPGRGRACGSERSRGGIHVCLFSGRAGEAAFPDGNWRAGPTSEGGARSRACVCVCLCVRARERRERGPARACAGAGWPQGPSGR